MALFPTILAFSHFLFCHYTMFPHFLFTNFATLQKHPRVISKNYGLVQRKLYCTSCTGSSGSLRRKNVCHCSFYQRMLFFNYQERRKVSQWIFPIYAKGESTLLNFHCQISPEKHGVTFEKISWRRT